MNIPTGWRRLNYGEKQLNTDVRQFACRVEELTTLCGVDLTTQFTKNNFPNHGNSYQFLRKIDSPWISVKERLPDRSGDYFVHRPNVQAHRAYFNANSQSWGHGEITHWMEIPPLPKEVLPPITIQEGGSTHELIFNKDGSIKAGCVTIDKEKMNQIVERWKKEQE